MHLETASRAAKVQPFRRFLLGLSRGGVFTVHDRDEQRGQKRRCTLSEIAAYGVRRARVSHCYMAQSQA